MVIRQRRFFVALSERCVCLQRPRQLDVVSETLWSLARIKPVIPLYQWRDLLLCGGTEMRTNVCKLRALSFKPEHSVDGGRSKLTLSARLIDGAMMVPVLVHAMVHTDEAQIVSCSGVGNGSL